MTTKKLTIEEVLKKKKIFSEKQVFNSEYFGCEIDIERVAADKILEIMSRDNEDEITKYTELIYLSCPFFRKKELHEALDIKIPTDSVKASYDDNICEILELGNLILSRYGFTTDKVDKIKKL